MPDACVIFVCPAVRAGEAETLFSPSEFVVTPPPKSDRKLGEALRYGDTLVLVDQLGSVWNNKTGQRTPRF
jgi:hypothetical protein